MHCLCCSWKMKGSCLRRQDAAIDTLSRRRDPCCILIDTRQCSSRTILLLVSLLLTFSQYAMVPENLTVSSYVSFVHTQRPLCATFCKAQTMDFASRLSFSEAVPQATNAWHSYSGQVAKSQCGESGQAIRGRALCTITPVFARGFLAAHVVSPWR